MKRILIVQNCIQFSIISLILTRFQQLENTIIQLLILIASSTWNVYVTSASKYYYSADIFYYYPTCLLLNVALESASSGASWPASPSNLYALVFKFAVLPSALLLLEAGSRKLRFYPLQGREIFKVKLIWYNAIKRSLKDSGKVIACFWTVYLLFGYWFFHAISIIASFVGFKGSLTSKFSIWPLLDVVLHAGLYARAVYVLAIFYIINANLNLYLTSLPEKKRNVAEIVNVLQAKSSTQAQRQIAFMELHNSVYNDSKFRQTIFTQEESPSSTLVMGSISPQNAWTSIETVCSKELDTLIESLDTFLKKETTQAAASKTSMLNSLKDIKQPPPLVKTGISHSMPGGSSIINRKKRSFVENATKAALELITESEDVDQDHQYIAPAAGPTHQHHHQSQIIPSVLLPSTESTLRPQAPSAILSRGENKEALKSGVELVLDRIAQVPILGPLLVPRKHDRVLCDFAVSVWAAQSMARLAVKAAGEDKYGRIHGKLEGLVTRYIRLYTLVWMYTCMPRPENGVDSGSVFARLVAYVHPNEMVEVERFQQVLEACVYMIVSEWYEEIGRIRFSFGDREAFVLQKFLDFQV